MTDDKSLSDDKGSPPKNKIYGLTGILNTGNTCYMNSAIQAFSHIYPLTNYFFSEKDKIYQTLRKNARKILKDDHNFKIETNNNIPSSLKQKIQNPEYKPEMLTNDELVVVYNNTITFQLIRLLEQMWSKNCVILPTSFRYIFGEARNKFFFGYEQHDAEEAYSCVLQKMQEELAEEQTVTFKSDILSVREFLKFKKDISQKMDQAASREEKCHLLNIYLQKKKANPTESLIVESYKEMQKYYGTNYCHITKIFSGFLYSSIMCPEAGCGYSSNKFEPFLHLVLPMPPMPPMPPMDARRISPGMPEEITIEKCMEEYCKMEVLDEQNLWNCESCNKKVKAVKKLCLWTVPPILVIQLKRFGAQRISKDPRMIKYPLEHLDISSMVYPSQVGKKCHKYTLQCVINHSGGLNNGHYFTYCKDEDSKRWFEFNDSQIKELHLNAIVSHTAYLLFYIREDMLC